MEKKLSYTEALLIMLKGGIVPKVDISESTITLLRWYAKDNDLSFVDSGCFGYRTFRFA